MKVVLEHITKRFIDRNKKNKTELVAVSDMCLDIPDGKLIGLLGPSGCGKSTTLNMICGLEKPSSGKIFFGDDDVTDLPPENRGVGMVFQSYALYPHLTVRQNITFPLENLKGDKKLTKQEMNDRALGAATRCPKCCCWTSLSQILMRDCVFRQERNSDVSRRRQVSPRSLSRTTRKKP